MIAIKGMLHTHLHLSDSVQLFVMSIFSTTLKVPRGMGNCYKHLHYAIK